jgi:uncharacterized repeat protein (TIGR01451 family)
MALGIDPTALFGNFTLRSLIPTRTTAAGRKTSKRAGDRGLGFESLEARQMMAADMAEIVGTIRLDLQNDGNVANDTLVQGATVKLWRDGGDGVFNSGGDDAIAAANVTSNSLGQYRFAGLGVGKYFVQIVLPAGLQTAPGGDVRTVTISSADSDGAIGMTIDEFDTFQKVEASPPPDSAGVNSTKTDPTVLGGERDFRVEITDGTDEFSSVSLISGGGLLRLASGAMVTGDATIVWDGQDGSASSINHTGLGGLDFTKDGPNRMTGIRLSVGADHPNAVVKLRIYSDATHWSEFTTTVPESVGGIINKQAVFDFASPTSMGGGGADFTKVGAIELTFVGVSAVDAQISVAELVGLTTKTADFTALSQLAVGNQVWQDSNNNGMLDNGEQGIAGVVINLYADTDNNNAYTPGVDVLAGTTTTDGTGKYQFTGLVTGNYVVQVDASNFGSGNALAGLKPSTGKSATDPDDNIDNDNNGKLLAGHGVVAAAVSLLGGTEPTADGDDANSNRTVDFGFFGFDLVLDKSVDQTTTAPLEELRYSVLVKNDGPAAAKSVQFKDTLPAGVTFESLTVSKGGVTLTHNSGIITGSLGDMAAGDQIIITIFVKVKATATGVLKNEAEVSAPDEEYTLNNYDEVETPVTPKIDLEIDKSDSQDPVAPGAQFSYSLVIKNNGPSAATGVTVLDTLPPQVTFVSSSRPNVSPVSEQLEFDLGNLAVGATATITITVQVDPTFVGTLLNTTQVSGNETETNYDNNDDEEPTLVQAVPGSIDGYVYNDKNNNGVKESTEKPLANVVISLTGNDFTGAFISRTTTTNSLGYYKFDGLAPGEYLVLQPSQPPKYKDGLDTLGNTFNGAGQMQAPNGAVSFDSTPGDGRDADGFEGIEISSGFAAKDYNFGELAITTNKRDFVRPMTWR